MFLTEEQYIEMCGHADFFILPYRKSHFKYRTSGQLVDAVIMGKPIIAVRKTWLGAIVQKYSIGLVFDDGDANQLAEAITTMSQNIKAIKRH